MKVLRFICLIIPMFYAMTSCEQRSQESEPKTKETLPYDDEGGLCGVFSISLNTYVNFSKGNLQYSQTNAIWRFADNQYDNVKSFTPPDRWMDAFAYATSGYGNYLPTKHGGRYDDGYYNGYEDITRTILDWSYYNKIKNGGNKDAYWFTMNRAQWLYVLCQRPYWYDKFMYAIINSTKGFILLPDQSNTFDSYGLVPSYVINDKGKLIEKKTTPQEISLDLWKQMELDGAVFLPSFGYGNQFGYWTSSSINDASVAWAIKYYNTTKNNALDLSMHLTRPTQAMVRAVRYVK